MEESRPFRFLDLPRELRYMVYERLPMKTTAVSLDYADQANHLVFEDDWRHDGVRLLNLTIFKRTIPGMTILASCRQINEEAAKIFLSRLEKSKTQPERTCPLQDGDLIQGEMFAVLDGILDGDFHYPHRGKPQHPYHYKFAEDLEPLLEQARTRYRATTAGYWHIAVDIRRSWYYPLPGLESKARLFCFFRHGAPPSVEEAGFGGSVRPIHLSRKGEATWDFQLASKDGTVPTQGPLSKYHL